MTAPALEVRGLRIVFRAGERKSTALDGVDLEVAPGEILALIGERGSGARALARAVAGAAQARPGAEITGSVRISGREALEAPPREAARARRDGLRALAGDPAGWPDPALPLARQGAEIGVEIDAALLAAAGLAAEEAAARPARALAEGARRRAGLALALAGAPPLLVLEAPADLLDPASRREMMAALRALARAAGTAVLLTARDLPEAAEAADRVLVLYAGRPCEAGPARGVLARPAHAYTAELLGARIDLLADRAGPLPTPPGARPAAAETGPRCGYVARCPIAVMTCERSRPPMRPLPWREGRAACLRMEAVAIPPRRARAPWPEAPAAPAGAALAIEAVTLAAPGRGAGGAALEAVTLALAPGEALALTGGPGAGKTALLRVAAGLAAPEAGRVARGGRRRPQLVLGAPGSGLTPWLSVGAQLGERLRGRGLSRREVAARVRGALAEVGLPGAERARPAQLTELERRRAAIARAVAAPPGLLLLDAPEAGLDPTAAAEILNLLGALRRSLGLTVLAATRDLAAARLLGDRVALMEAGRVREIAPAERIAAAAA